MIYNVTLETTGGSVNIVGNEENSLIHSVALGTVRSVINTTVKHASYRFEVEAESVLEALCTALRLVHGEVMAAHVVPPDGCRLI